MYRYLRAQWGCRDDHCPFSPQMISEALMRRKFSRHWKKTFWPYACSKLWTIYPFGKLPTFGQLISVQIEKIKVNNIANIMRWKFGFVWTIHQVLFWILTNTAFYVFLHQSILTLAVWDWTPLTIFLTPGGQLILWKIPHITPVVYQSGEVRAVGTHYTSVLWNNWRSTIDFWKMQKMSTTKPCLNSSSKR